MGLCYNGLACDRVGQSVSCPENDGSDRSAESVSIWEQWQLSGRRDAGGDGGAGAGGAQTPV